MKRLAGARSVCFDAYGTDSEGKKYDLEVQRADKGADPYRARYHSSVMDIENLDAGQAFCELPETYVIFITETDFFGWEKPVYQIERINVTTGNPFHDGEHILYVNGTYEGETELGKLMHDFNCTDPENMNYELMAEGTRYLKENPEGVKLMCRIMEELREEALREGMEKGMEKGIQNMVWALKELGTPDGTILMMLEEKYELNEEEARKYL